MSGKAEKFLAELAADLRKEIVAINRMDSALVERDIAARRREAALGRRWANMRTKIQKGLERLGIGEAEWCKRELDCDIRTMRRRVQLARGWTQYEAARREAGNNGQYGLVYGLSVIGADRSDMATNGHRLSVRSPKDRKGWTPPAVSSSLATHSLSLQAAFCHGQCRHLLTALLAGQTVVWR